MGLKKWIGISQRQLRVREKYYLKSPQENMKMLIFKKHTHPKKNPPKKTPLNRIRLAKREKGGLFLKKEHRTPISKQKKGRVGTI